MKLNVVYNKDILGCKDALEMIEQLLISKKFEFKSFELQTMERFGEFTFVIGGDGTLLKAAKFYSEFQVPVMGINLGRLGFLSQTSVEGVSFFIDEVSQGNYTVERRLMLQSSNLLALNDFVIKGSEPSRTSKFYLEINGESVCDYIADGLIISTPTGSTAYGLSAGGPILHPALEAITIVPICPHTLTVRPLVVPPNEMISIKTGDKALSISIDGFDLDKCVDKINIKASSNSALLAFLNDEKFYSVLRNKLHWGISPEIK